MTHFAGSLHYQPTNQQFANGIRLRGCEFFRYSALLSRWNDPSGYRLRLERRRQPASLGRPRLVLGAWLGLIPSVVRSSGLASA